MILTGLFTGDFFSKLLQFSAVGFSGLFLDFGITFLLKEKIKINPFLANAAGFYTAASSNYYFNRVWTFNSHNPRIAEEYSLFIGISLAGLFINSIILWALTRKMKMNFYLAKAIATAVTMLWNFIANLLLVFTR